MSNIYTQYLRNRKLESSRGHSVPQGATRIQRDWEVALRSQIGREREQGAVRIERMYSHSDTYYRMAVKHLASFSSSS